MNGSMHSKGVLFLVEFPDPKIPIVLRRVNLYFMDV